MLKVLPKPQKAVVLSEESFGLKDTNIVKEYEAGLGKEGYRLKITKDGCTSYAENEAGHFYASVTLKQLMEAGRLSDIEIEDRPAYPYRGYMLDCCRHFFGIDTIKKQLDAMALLKLNVFHWHLTEDQGWRIPIDKYPSLTKIGSVRKGTRGDGVSVSGFYTKDEIRSIVAYAKERFIEVIPEVDIPGHMTAAIAALPELSCHGNQVEVSQAFGIHKEVACAGKEKVYQILCDILDEVAELFPSEFIHLGGDEALRLNWLDCPDCKAVMERENLKDEDELQAYFMGRITKHLAEKGKRVLNWNDGMIAENCDKSIIIHYWQERKINKNAAIREINNGRNAVISPFFSYYLDYPYGMTPLKKTFMFNPVLDGIDGGKADRILGVEAPLWTEYVENEEQLEYQTYPRLLAVAERGWNGKNDILYEDFVERSETVYKLFDKIGIKYATIKDANPNFVKGKLKVIKFYINTFDKTLRENLKYLAENKRRLKEKYRK